MRLSLILVHLILFFILHLCFDVTDLAQFTVYQMPEKSVPTATFRPNSLLHWRLGALLTTISLGILIFWVVDESTISNLVDWSYRKDFASSKIYSQAVNPAENSSQIAVNLTSPADSELIRDDLKPYVKSISAQSTRNPSLNLTLPYVPAPAPISDFLDWISVRLDSNFTTNLLNQLSMPSTNECSSDSRTVDITILNLDLGKSDLKLPSGEVFEIVFHALDDSGNRQCSGGDYFETDLSGESWKSRPPVTDFSNGSYSLKLQVHPEFAGNYNLTIILLFRHFEGLKFSSSRFAFNKQLRQIPIKFYRTDSKLPDPQTCTKFDFTREIWTGRWTRHANNISCEISNDGRYRCLKPDLPCKNPWCNGSLGLLESNGWVYSSHCSFKIFSGESAWDCLQNRWIFFWGDSNHVDSIRNLLYFILDVPNLHLITRRFDLNFTNPKNPTQSIRITSIFNGHWNESKNYLGIQSLQNEGFRDLLKGYFAGETVPDTMIMNSGLHDGIYWPSIKRFIKGADYTANFWSEILNSMKNRGLKPTKIIYRTTVATGGYARLLAFNPNKMEVMNEILLDKMRTAEIISGVIDGFDLTFPWHYDNRASDGVHYGRAPAKMKWRDGEIGHQYFVDLMLVHVWLNVLCAR